MALYSVVAPKTGFPAENCPEKYCFSHILHFARLALTKREWNRRSSDIASWIEQMRQWSSDRAGRMETHRLNT